MNDESSVRVWVDDRDPVFRAELIQCLRAFEFTVTGESATLVPEPIACEVDILIFDLEIVCLTRAVRLVQDSGTKLIAIARPTWEEILFEAMGAGLAGLLTRSDLTCEALVGCLRSVIRGHQHLPSAALARLLSLNDEAGLTTELDTAQFDIDIASDHQGPPHLPTPRKAYSENP